MNSNIINRASKWESGSIDCNANDLTCTLNCEAQSSCGRKVGKILSGPIINCPTNFDCTECNIYCSSSNACTGSIIYGYNCDLLNIYIEANDNKKLSIYAPNEGSLNIIVNGTEAQFKKSQIYSSNTTNDIIIDCSGSEFKTNTVNATNIIGILSYSSSGNCQSRYSSFYCPTTNTCTLDFSGSQSTLSNSNQGLQITAYAGTSLMKYSCAAQCGGSTLSCVYGASNCSTVCSGICVIPTSSPTMHPSFEPTLEPSLQPTAQPFSQTSYPTIAPSFAFSSSMPTNFPLSSINPTKFPTNIPSLTLSMNITNISENPSKYPTFQTINSAEDKTIINIIINNPLMFIGGSVLLFVLILSIIVICVYMRHKARKSRTQTDFTNSSSLQAFREVVIPCTNTFETDFQITDMNDIPKQLRKHYQITSNSNMDTMFMTIDSPKKCNEDVFDDDESVKDNFAVDEEIQSLECDEHAVRDENSSVSVEELFGVDIETKTPQVFTTGGSVLQENITNNDTLR